MEEFNKFLLKALMHILLVSIIALFCYQTYKIIQSIDLTTGYKIISIIAIIGLLHYTYKICEQIYNYRRRHAWRPSEEMMRYMYELRNPKPQETITKDIPIGPTISPIDDVIDVKINLNLDKKLFYGRDLDVEEKYYLLNHKYQKGSFVPIGKTRQEECYVKANNIESLEHTFLVENIKQKIQIYTIEVKIGLSRDPDIIFQNAKKEIVAIEVETGKGYKKHKLEFEEKFYITQKRYKKNLYIVLTDSRYKTLYHKLFPKIKILLRQDIPALLSSQFLPAGRHSIPASKKRDTGRENAE